jgi:transcriptional regulator with XRE-family HTH domain
VTVTDQLRQAIERSEHSRYAICKALDIDQGQLSRFMHGECGLSLDVLDRLCGFLKLELRTAERK